MCAHSLTAELSSLWAFTCPLALRLTPVFFYSDKIQALSYAQHTRQLISCGSDGGIVIWNMDVERQEVGARLLGWALPFLAMVKNSSAIPPADFLLFLQLNLEIRHDMLEEENFGRKGVSIFCLSQIGI